jgi:mandelamide amidase
VETPTRIANCRIWGIFRTLVSLDAPVAAKLRDAGAIIIGKTNMHEKAFGISGHNAAFKTGPEPGVRNAYDSTKIAGGSSSGTAIAIGARIVTAGLGTDTGGSVRIPCALSGCASLRPTVGRYPGEGITPISHTRDTAGPMAATIADVAVLDRVIARGGPIAPANPKEVRIGVAGATLVNLDGDTDAAFRAALDKLRKAGVTVIDVEMPKLADLNGQIGFPIALYEAYDDMVAYLNRSGTGITIGELAKQIASPDMKGAYNGLVIPRKLPGPDSSVVDAKPAYDAAMKTARPALQALYRDSFTKNRLDAIAFPIVPEVAIPANPEASSLANSSCSSRTPTPEAMPASPASSSRSRWVPRRNCRSDSNSTVLRAAIDGCLRSGWRLKGFLDVCRRHRRIDKLLIESSRKPR